MRLPSFLRRSHFWFLAFACWAITLWILSDGPVPDVEGPQLPHFDKLMHFGYFFGGAGLLSAALFLQGDHPPSWPALMFRVCAILWSIGILDEWHQSWVPERSGNDVGDWLADATGTVVGALTFRRFHSVLA